MPDNQNSAGGLKPSRPAPQQVNFALEAVRQTVEDGNQIILAEYAETLAAEILASRPGALSGEVVAWVAPDWENSLTVKYLKSQDEETQKRWLEFYTIPLYAQPSPPPALSEGLTEAGEFVLSESASIALHEWEELPEKMELGALEKALEIGAAMYAALKAIEDSGSSRLSSPAPMVHNHGPEEGAGLACPETRAQDGSLRGACMSAPAAPLEGEKS